MARWRREDTFLFASLVITMSINLISLKYVLLIAFGLFTHISAAEAGQSAEARMRDFLLVLDSRQPARLSGFFHPIKKIEFRSFDVATGRLLGGAEYTRLEIAVQLKKRKSFAYHHFFDEPNGQTFRADWSASVSLRVSPQGTFRNRHAPETTYIRWEDFNGTWFIVELGETLS